MRTPPRPLISQHRAARLNVWARLWLMWFVGFCAAWWRDDRDQARDVARVAHTISSLVIVNAVSRVAPPPRPNNRHGRLNPSTLRTMAGAGLRHALHGRDWRARLMAILCVMRDLDAHAAALARRLRRGLTRLRIIDPKPEPGPALPRIANTIASADSS